MHLYSQELFIPVCNNEAADPTLMMPISLFAGKSQPPSSLAVSGDKL